jgi:hypothetical protein
MNERIRELVRESNLDVYGLGKERYRWEYTVEKFAELIVKECCQIVLECSITGSNNERDFMVTVREIKQHFGVEE